LRPGLYYFGPSGLKNRRAATRICEIVVRVLRGYQLRHFLLMMTIVRYSVLTIATFPLIYYLLVIYSSWRFFRHPFDRESAGANSFTPPISNLKPVRGVDPDAYENFASFCRQDYPDYELLFCVGGKDDPIVPVLEKLIRDFPERQIRILFGAQSDATNDKAAKLARLVSEARHEFLVISDSDVRATPDYLRTVVAPLADPRVGAATCLYVPIEMKTLAEGLQAIGMASDFYAAVMVGRQLDGIKFALGPTIATTRTRLAGFGGYQAIANQPGDDVLVGRLIAEQGYEVILLSYPLQTVSDYQSMPDLIRKRMRWFVVMRHMRPRGHLGLLLTQGLPWSLAAIAVHRTMGVAVGYLGAYLGLRLTMTWLIGIKGLRDHALWRKMWLVVVWDALAFFLWMASFGRNSFHWRGGEYAIRDGQLVSVTARTAGK
jgi:ceramide glucosyltransferase